MIQHDTYQGIDIHLEHARRKYAWHPDMTGAEKFRLAERELHEMAAAMLKKDARGTRHEALDCIAVLVRIVEDD